jgi:hypothetical protein
MDYTTLIPESKEGQEQPAKQMQSLYFLVVLCSPSHAQKVCVLFASVCLFLRIVVEVAVVVCPVPEFKVLPHLSCSAIVLIHQETNAERH